MMGCAPTPYSLANDDDDPFDVFEAIFPQYIDPDDPSLGEHPYWEEKRKAMWARFHDTGIGNPDVDYWIRCMKARDYEIGDRYAPGFRAWTEYQARLAANTGEADLSDSSMESESVQKGYNPPNVLSPGDDASDYLAEQNINRFRQSTQGGLEPQTVADYGRAVRDPFEDWAREFDRLFYWGM